jgi:DNA (cytosine-5)-methyltransferase 1
MRVLDLFSGIGGFSLGLERAGMTTVAFCEINPTCRLVLGDRWPSIPIHNDITALEAPRVGPVDVICGGFPCQDISAAGRGAGIEGARSGLWREYARLIRAARPSYVIVENVAALLGRGLDRVLWDLAALGYDAEWRCISARECGADHARDRIWIVAYPSREGWQGPQPNDGILERAAASLTKHVHPAFSGWRAVAEREYLLRGGDGLSVGMERLRIHALGNAIIPQIAEAIGRAIIAAEQSQAPDTRGEAR